MTDEQIAWIIHEAHRAYQMTDALHPTHVMPAPPWVTMNPWQQGTVIMQVQGVREDLEEMGTFIFDEDLAARSHARWVARMTEAGWEKGKDKNPIRKTHPNLVNWDQLSAYEQAKTRQAVAIAKVHLEQ